MSAVLEQAETLPLAGAHWCELTKVGLKVRNKKFSYEEWEQIRDPLIIADKGSQFGLGDWLHLGHARHGEKIAQAVDAHDKTGVKIKTLMEYRRVSERVPYSIRMESLDWSHHQVVASAPEDERSTWLRLAVENDWKPDELRKAIREAAKPAVNLDAEDDQDYLDPHYKTFLLDYITTQYAFLNRCTYEPFKKEIERTIKVARYQHRRTRTTDYESVREQIDQGACTVEEIAEEVYLTESEIKAFCVRIIGCETPSKADDPREAGTPYEWRPIGVNTEMAKGSRAYGVFRKDAPSGDDFDIPSTYHPNVEWESEED